MQLIKVLHILDSLNCGGAEVMTLDVCRNAKANGLDLTFLATGGGDLEEDFRRSGFDFLRLKRRLPLDLGLAAQIRRIVQERKIQVVHGHQPVEALHLYLATRNSGIKRVLTTHGVVSGAKNELALQFVIPRTDGLVAISRDLLNWLKKGRSYNTSRSVSLINNGVDFKRLQSRVGNLHNELNLPAEARLIGMVANFRPGMEKDQLTVCRALPRLFAAVPGSHFVFAGGRSEEAPHLFDDCVRYCHEQQISERVHFLGKRSDVGDVLASLDVFVLSSRSEGSPISVIEAMMMGVPTVLSDIRSLHEVSDNARCALLFRAGDSEDLAVKLIQLLNNSEQRVRLGLRAQKWAFEKFSIEQHISNLAQFYFSLMKKSFR